MKYHIITYGCQTNYSDSQRVSSILEQIGYQLEPDKKQADLIVINVCSIRQSAVNRVYGQIKNIKKNNSKVIITGCVLEKDKKKLSKEIDFVLDIKDLPKWPIILNKEINQKYQDFFSIKPKTNDPFLTYIPIINGCNNFCSYCVVPYTRGREISRDFNEIIKEAKTAIKNGAKEIWLLGQNVNSYKSNNYNFCDLIKSIDSIPGNFWIRFVSSHPKDFTDEMIETMKNSDKITNYLNLPVQSGSDKILKEMNRPYKISDYKKFIEKIKKDIPNITLSTDVIVGFPGETEKEFQETAKLMEEIGFDMAYISEYSPRPGTTSFKLNDDVSLKEKNKRWLILTEILEKSALLKNQNLINKNVEVLIEKEKNGYLLGKTKEYKNIKFKGSTELIRKFVIVKVKDVFPWKLEGEIISQK